MALTPRKAAKLLSIWLRIVAFSMFFALIAVVMPTSWLEACVSVLEPGSKVTLLTQYLARGTSMAYFVVGGLFWIFAGDVRKYANPLHFAMYCYLVACTIGLMVMLIEKFTSGTPATLLFYGILLDLIFGLAMAIFVLFMSRQASLSTI